jgi:hypothetical protein
MNSLLCKSYSKAAVSTVTVKQMWMEEDEYHKLLLDSTEEWLYQYGVARSLLDVVVVDSPD